MFNAHSFHILKTPPTGFEPVTFIKSFLTLNFRKRYDDALPTELRKHRKVKYIRVGVVGNISACHADARGSIPRHGGKLIIFLNYM